MVESEATSSVSVGADWARTDFTAASGRPGCVWTAWFFAIGFPALMLLLFPFPFPSFDSAGGGFLAFGTELKAVFVAAIPMAMIAFAVGHTSLERRAYWAGALFAASLAAFTLGLALLPASILGLGFMFIGLIGLCPFPVALVYLLGALHLYSREAREKRFARAAVGFSIFLALAGGLQWAATTAYVRGIKQVCSSEPEVRSAGIRRLERWSFWLDSLRMQDEYSRTSDPVIKARIDHAYYLLTGNEIERPWTPRSE